MGRIKKVIQFIWNLFKQYWVEVGLSCLLALALSVTTFTYEVPFKSFGDVWAHLAFVNELKKPLDQVGDPYFSEGTKDPHYGLFPLIVAQASNILNVNHVIVMQFGGIVSTIFLFFCLLFAYFSFFPERQGKNIDKIVLFVISFLGWESFKLSYAGYYSLADIAIGIMFPHMFALGLFLITIVLYYKTLLLQKQNNPKDDKKILFLQVIIGIITGAILVTHIITGIVLFYTMGLFTAYFFFFEFGRRLDKQILFNIAIPLIAVFLALLWPYFNFIEPFVKLETVHVASPVTSIFEFKEWLAVAGVMFMGVFSVLASKKKVLIFWFAGMVFILASYLYPVRISSYWRFFPVTLIPISFIMTNWLSQLDKVIRTFILFLLLIFGVSSFINKIDTIGYRQAISPNTFDFLTIVPEDKVVFSDPETSYLFTGLTGRPVLVVEKTHWNPSNQDVAAERYEDSHAFWRYDDETGAIYVIEKYKLEYVLINKRLIKNYNDYGVMLGAKYKIKELYQNRNYLLIQIIY